jgi:hypothetical protein
VHKFEQQSSSTWQGIPPTQQLQDPDHAQLCNELLQSLSLLHGNKYGLPLSVFSSAKARGAIKFAPTMETMIAIKTISCILKGSMVQPNMKYYV